MFISILLITSLVAANLPWMTDRTLLLFAPMQGGKPVWLRLLEWLVMYILMAGIAIGLEIKSTGTSHDQGWELFWVTFCLFMIFALPGFIYRHDLKHLLDRARR